MENRPENCLCRSTTGLFIAKKQASLGLSALLVCLLLSFLAGYFWGRRQPVANLTEQLSSAVLAQAAELNKIVPDSNNPKDQAGLDQDSQVNLTTEQQYQGTILGFNSLKAARKYLNKLQNLGYNLQLKTQHSRNSKNKLYTWYQIVTEKFTDKAKLEQLMQAIKVQENLSSTKIIEL